MNHINLGYACINMTLSSAPKKQKITTNRSMIRKTFLEKGLEYASSLALENIRDLEKILLWNEENGFKFFRISSDMFPWASEYSFEQLNDFEEITNILQRIGSFAKNNGHRLTFHPGPFNKLCSDKQQVLQNTITDLSIHGKIFDIMGLDRSPYNKINIHVGAHYGNKDKTLDRFCKNFDLLPDSVRSRLTVENDDKEGLYSVAELYEGVYKKTQIPIVFDFHHHNFNAGNLNEEDALGLASSTWNSKHTPVVHYSESRSREYNIKCRPQAHSDYINGPIRLYNHNVDVMIEAKQKELAMINYLKMEQ